MNKLSVIAVSALLPFVANAINVNITATANDVRDSGGSAVSVGQLGLLIVDTNGDGVSLSAGSFTLDSFYNSSDDYIAGSIGVTNFITSNVQFSTENADDAGLAQGDEFYIAWFPTLASSATSIGAGTSYGLTRGGDWILPADSGSTSGLSAATGGSANLTVVPEPSSYAILSAVACAAFAVSRRRR